MFTESEQKIIVFLISVTFLGLAVMIITAEKETEFVSFEDSTGKSVYNLSEVTNNELISIPGIGYSLAENIINYRNDYGFGSVSDLKEVRGIGEHKYSEIHSYFFLAENKESDSEFSANVSEQFSDLVNINHSDLHSLLEVRNIGERRANDILKFIRDNGPLNRISELKQIPGIGEQTIKNLKKHFYAGEVKK